MPCFVVFFDRLKAVSNALFYSVYGTPSPKMPHFAVFGGCQGPKCFCLVDASGSNALFYSVSGGPSPQMLRFSVFGGCQWLKCLAQCFWRTKLSNAFFVGALFCGVC
eukprot:1973679-Amphidinium_carterae.1